MDYIGTRISNMSLMKLVTSCQHSRKSNSPVERRKADETPISGQIINTTRVNLGRNECNSYPTQWQKIIHTTCLRCLSNSEKEDTDLSKQALTPLNGQVGHTNVLADGHPVRREHREKATSTLLLENLCFLHKIFTTPFHTHTMNKATNSCQTGYFPGR